MTATTSPPAALDATLQQAISHHRAGQLQDAERCYRAILQAQPEHPDANHNLGVLAVQVKQPAAGLPHFKTALEARPNQGQYWLSYIDALLQAGQQDAARQVLDQGRQRGLQGEAVEALAQRLAAAAPSGAGEPGHQEMSELALLFNQGDYAAAEKRSCSLTERFPQHGFGWKVLGAVLHKLGRAEDSLQAKRRAAHLLPDDAEAHNNLGNSLREQGRPGEAESSLRRALALNPGYAEAHNNLGDSLRELGRLPEAEASFRRALEIRPDYADAYNNLGIMLYEQGRFAEAEACYRQALQSKPDYAEAHNNLGNMFFEQGRFAEAESSLRRALEITVGRVSNVSQLAAYNYGLCLGERGQHRESVAYYQQAFAERAGWQAAADPTLSSGLAHAYIELTNKCNFHCDFCPSDAQHRAHGFMNLELICQLYDEFAGKKLVKQVDLHLMGEPTLHPDLLKVLEYAAAKNIKTELVTNGSTLNAKTAPRMLDALYGTLAVSLQTPTRETFKHRGETGLSWDRYIENIRLLVREHLRRVASKQVCRHALELRVMITRDSKLSANIIESSDDIHRVMREWCDFVAAAESELGLPPFERQALPAELFAASLTQTSINHPLQQGLTLKFWQGFTFANSMLSDDYALAYEPSASFCSRPFLDVAVLSNGDVTLCCLDYDGKLAVGNMKDGTLESILNGKPTMDLRAAMFGRQPLPHFCQQCQAKAVPVADQGKAPRATWPLHIVHEH